MNTDAWGDMIINIFHASGADASFYAGIDAERRGDFDTSRRLLAESKRIMDEYAEAQNEKN